LRDRCVGEKEMQDGKDYTQFVATRQEVPGSHCNHYSEEGACEHCGGVIRHEGSCLIVNKVVYYAGDVVAGIRELTLHDQLVLHALGVSWDARPGS